MTLEQHLMEEFGLSRETVRTYLSPVSGGGSGLGPDVLSAYADYAADVLIPWQYDKGVQMSPGGNTGVARHGEGSIACGRARSSWRAGAGPHVTS